MSCAVLSQPEAEPSAEAAHAALLFAHVAWNRAAVFGARGPDYRPMLREFEASNPRLWDELKSSDAEALVTELAASNRHTILTTTGTWWYAACAATTCTSNGSIRRRPD